MATPPTFQVGEVLTASQMNTIGTHLITPTSVSGSGTSLVGGEVRFTNSTSVSVNGCFNNDYTNYRVVWIMTTSSGAGQFLLRLRNAGSDNVASYSTVGSYWYLSGGSGFQVVQGNQNVSFGGVVGGSPGSAAQGGGFLEFYRPKPSSHTTIDYRQTAQIGNTGCETYAGSIAHFTTYSADGFTLFANASAFNFTGSLHVYGYRD